MEWIAERVEMMAGCYRRDDYANPAIFLAAAGAVLEEFPDAVVENVTSPKTGIQAEASFPPSLAELKARCVRSERALQNIELAKARSDRVEPQIAPPVDRTKHETIEELRAKYPDLLSRRTDRPHRAPVFRSLAEIAAEAGVSAEAIAAIPDAKVRAP